MSKHTPGPWKFRKMATTFSVRTTMVNQGWLVAMVPIAPKGTRITAGGMTEKEANARLIAAAPDMLAALKCLVGQTEGRFLEYSNESNARQWAIDAIAKAEGREK